MGPSTKQVLSKPEQGVDRIEAHRTFFANLVTANAGVPLGEPRLAMAFGATPRERFVGPGPWRVFTSTGYIDTPTDDPAFLYQDIVIALAEVGQINNGQPALHAYCLSALKIKEGEAALHIGAGTGYYTAVLARMVGPEGSVAAYEIEEKLAGQAKENLADLANVTVHHRSGAEGPLPGCDIIYVNAGATEPLDVWLDALRPGGRLLLPLTPAQGPGGMLLVTRGANDAFEARMLLPVMFIPCVGARDEETAKKLSEAFKKGTMRDVRSLQRGSTPPDETCWCAGNGWWLSTAANQA
jgi:protein-L-isoaspartate(D-aspartate) O-methyltransferase